jgi:hypothetical protein
LDAGPAPSPTAQLRGASACSFEEWTIGDDGLIAASLGRFDEAEYRRLLEHGVGS